VASAWLATAWDQDVALPVMSPVAARLHDVVTTWLADLLGLPAGTAAAFVSGASMANTTALAAARDHQLAQAGWDVQADGLFGAPGLTVVIGEYAHSTVVKALGLLGLGRDRVLVRADRVAGAPGHADQRLRLGNDRRGHQAKRGRHHRRGPTAGPGPLTSHRLHGLR